VGAEEARCAALTASACGIELIRMPRDPGPVRLPLTSPLAWAEQPLSLCDDLSQVRRLMAIGQPAISGLGSDELLATGRRRPGLRRSIVGRLKRKLVRRRPSPPVPAAVAADLQALLDDREQAWVAPALRSEASSGAETQDAAAVVWTDLLLPNGGFRTDVEARDGAGLFRAEVSLPFLDHRVVALMLDPQLAQADIERWPNSPGKQFLRRMLQGQVPGAVWQRSKQPAGQPTFQRFAELELAMARNQLALIPGLDRYVCLNKLPEIDVDRPWSTLYPVLACTSLGSWLFHHSGVEQQWQVIRMQ
jgi:hypothetical protein